MSMTVAEDEVQIRLACSSMLLKDIGLFEFSSSERSESEYGLERWNGIFEEAPVVGMLEEPPVVGMLEQPPVL